MKNQFLSDSYIRQKLRQYRIVYGRDPTIAVIHPDDGESLTDIYRSSRPYTIFDGCYLYGVRVVYEEKTTRDTITLI